MSRLNKQIVIAEQPNINFNQVVENAALFNPDGSPYTNAPRIERDHYFTTGITVPSNTWFNPDWVLDTGRNHDDLLDLSTLNAPTVVEAGVYCVSVEWQFPNTTEIGKSFYFELDLDLNGDDPNVATNQSLDPLNDPGGVGIQAALAMTYYVPQNGVISLAVQHNLSVAPTNCLFTAWVQRLS